MGTTRFLLILAVCFAFHGELKPESVIERAIVAQGGAEKVARLRTMRIKMDGKTDRIPGMLESPVTIEDTWQMPNQYKSVFTFEVGGKKFTPTRVIDGDKGWIDVMGETQEMSKEVIAEMKEQWYAEGLDRLGFLKDKGLELSLLQEIKIENKPANGVLVRTKGHRDVKLYFDKETGLLVKRENKLDEGGKELLQEVFFSDYEEKKGLKHYRKIVTHHDGKKFIEATVVELEYFDKLDSSVFAKPEK
jgi:hypothetical protein